MRADGFGRLDDLLVRGGAVAVADVVHDGAGEDEAVLHHDAHLGAQGVQGHLRDIYAVYGDPAASDVVETAQQVDDGGLARAGGSHDGEGFAGHGGEAHVVQGLDAFLIGEGNVVEADFPGDGRHFLRVGSVLYGDRRIDGLKNTLQIGDGGEQRIVEIRQGGDGGPEPADVSGKGHQNAHGGRAAVHRHIHNGNIQEGGGHGGDHVHGGSHHEVEAHGLHPCLAVAVAQTVENTAVFLLADEGLGYADAVDAFRDIGVQVGLLVALDLPGPVLSFLDDDGEEGEDGQAAHAHQGQLHVDGQHEEDDEDQAAQIRDGV